MNGPLVRRLRILRESATPRTWPVRTSQSGEAANGCDTARHNATADWLKRSRRVLELMVEQCICLHR